MTGLLLEMGGGGVKSMFLFSVDERGGKGRSSWWVVKVAMKTLGSLQCSYKESNSHVCCRDTPTQAPGYSRRSAGL